MALEPTAEPPAEPTADPLRRAVRAARAERPEHAARWPDVARSVRSRLRALPGGPRELLLRQAGDGERTLVSSRVVVAVLRERLQQPTHAPHGIRLRVEGESLAAVELTLVVAFGVVLHELADRVRDDVRAAVADLLGPAAPPSLPVDVAVNDVVDGDPRLT